MKNELNGAGEYSPEEISQIISRYRSGDVSLAEFARQEGIPKGRLHYWIYDKGLGEGGGGHSSATPRLAFQEVRLAAPLGGVAEWAAEVSLPAGVLVRFSGKAKADWIGSIVQALQRPC
jgi:transposase-like protein